MSHNKPTYAELENQIAELKRQNEFINRNSAIQNTEKEKRSAELIIANKELIFQNEEKEKRAAELIIANKELIFQNNEKEKRAAELIIANKELAFQNEEKEKRAAELIVVKERQKAAELLEKIASRVPGMVYQFRLNADGSSCYPYVSLAIQEIYQVKPEEVHESSAKAFAVIHPEDYEQFITSINLSAENLTPWKHEYRTRFANGVVRWLLGNALPECENDGSTLWHGFITDITEHKLTEEAMQAAKQEAMRANQAKSEFLANMSHEIRTPMNAILGFSEILSDLITDSTKRYYLHAIKTSGKTLLQLINDILDLSKIEARKFALQYAPVSVRALLEDMNIVFSQKAADKSIDFSVLIDEKLPESLLLDEIRLRQVLLNLIGNAIKFTEHGFVKVKVSVNFEALPEKVNLKFEIYDTGMGIPKEQQEKIFAAFTQQDNQSLEYGGTGLGLTICKRLLELMQGNIEVESEVGKGSCFTLMLNNVAIVTNTPIVPVTDSFTPFHFQPAQILLVDDIKLNRLLIITYLAEFSELAIIEAKTGKQALSLAEQQHFDLILMDRRLPDINGDSVCQQIKALPDCADIPIIMITASVLSAMEKQQPLFYDLQLNKPVNKADLLVALQSFLPVDKTPPLNKIPQFLTAKMREGIEETVNLQKLQELLASDYQERLKKFGDSDGFNISVIITIAEQLLEIAEQTHCSLLANWANALKTQARLFDIANLTKTLKGFDALLKQLRE